MNHKYIGLLVVWGAEDWVSPAIKQAQDICDEVIICVDSYTPALDRFKDKTLSIVESKLPNSLVTYTGDKTSCSTTKAQMLNMMLAKSRLIGEGNWIWILDVDEYYTDESISYIKEYVDAHKDCNIIEIESKFFLVDMKHYLNASHNRLFQITAPNMNPKRRFYPSQNWIVSSNKRGLITRDQGMFHYSMLTNPNMRKVFWNVEFSGDTQDDKTLWLDSIYKNYDLAEEDKWIAENKKLFGIKSPWFNQDFVPDKTGKLFVYDGVQPKYIEESNLIKVEDFRAKYGFTKVAPKQAKSNNITVP